MYGQLLYETIYYAPPWKLLPSNEIADWDDFANKFMSNFTADIDQDELVEVLQENYEIAFIEERKRGKDLWGHVSLAVLRYIFEGQR